MDRGAWRATVHLVTRGVHDEETHIHTCISHFCLSAQNIPTEEDYNYHHFHFLDKKTGA